jgi:hypothetical protein
MMHLHGLILKTAFHGWGIDTAVLQMLVDQYQGRMNSINVMMQGSFCLAKPDKNS